MRENRVESSLKVCCFVGFSEIDVFPFYCLGGWISVRICCSRAISVYKKWNSLYSNISVIPISVRFSLEWEL